jgi:hypothetical protein
MHLEMLAKSGIRLMENIYMDEIAKQKVYEFCLFAAPLRHRNLLAKVLWLCSK